MYNLFFVCSYLKYISFIAACEGVHLRSKAILTVLLLRLSLSCLPSLYTARMQTINKPSTHNYRLWLLLLLLLLSTDLLFAAPV